MPTNLITKQARCAQCNKQMVILLGMGVSGMFKIQEMMQLEMTGALHGSFQCRVCGRYYCYDCSDSEKNCKCGQCDWGERQYLDSGFAQKIGAVRALDIIKYPRIILVVGFLFYALHVYGLMTGQMTLKPEHKVLEYVMNWLPAIVIFMAGRKLMLPVLVAGILALAGPAVITCILWLL